MEKLILLTTLCALISCNAEERPVTDRAPAMQTDLKCSPKGNARSTAPTRKEYQQLKLHLEQFIDPADQIRPPEYQPLTILGRLHPWFAANICAKTWSEQTIFILPSIPGYVIDDIRDAAQPEKKNGIAILNAEFWQEVSAIQEKGLKVAFLQFTKDFEVAGVYSGEEKLVGFDVFANPGTPRHEYRHHLQHQAELASRKRFDLNPKCKSSVGRFLGELDSTTLQIESWVGVFDNIETEDISGDVRNYPQSNFLYANLSYPTVAAEWIDRSSCPSDLIAAIDVLVSKTGAALREITKRTTRLAGLHATLVQIEKERSRQCPDAGDSSFTCTSLANRAARIRNEAREIKTQINAALVQEAKARPVYIREEFNKMSPRTRVKMDRSSGAYHLLMNEDATQ